jgi:hypothetical protein
VSDSDPGAGLPAPVVVVLATAVTVLLTLWAAFLVPLRLGSVPAPAWLVPLVAMLVVARAASRRAGLAGALLPGVAWLGLSWLVLGATRTEGDLVVPATASGYAYLFGGLLAWAALVTAASGADRRRRTAPAQPAASPRPPARRQGGHADRAGSGGPGAGERGLR